MFIPEFVTEQIERRFGGRFRLRWSNVENVFLYEQKVRRALAEGFAPKEFKSERHRKQTYEAHVRRQDGYMLTMKIAAGTTVECPTCGGDIKVPAFRSAQTHCGFCKSKGRQSVFNGGYWPIGDTLLDHLDKMDPDRGGLDRALDANTKSDLWAEHEREWQVTSTADAAYRENFRRLVGIPQTGLSGSTKMWQNAPESKKTWKGEKG